MAALFLIPLAFFLTAFLVNLVAMVSPGPDFLLVSRNSLVASRKAGVWTAAGIATGIMLHVSYALLGIGFVIAQSVLLYNTIKYVGAAYLLYIGCKALFHRKPSAEQREQIEKALPKRLAISPAKAFRMGFICNILNPKATLFFLAFFTQMVSPDTPTSVILGLGAMMVCSTFVWFSTVAVTLSAGPIRARYESVRGAIDRALGAILIALGLKVALGGRD